MPNQDKETVRRVLEVLLKKLEGEPSNSEEAASTVLFSESSNSSAPVIVVLGGLNSSAQDVAQRQPGIGEIGPPAAAKLSASAHREPQALHPGLERFPLAGADSHAAAPKACFMEPGRTCVSSGACEMRGY
jgi:hypothetical protein